MDATTQLLRTATILAVCLALPVFGQIPGHMCNDTSCPHLTISLHPTPPFAMLVPDTSPQEYKGFLPDLLQELSHIMGFKHSIKLVSDGTYGSLNVSGLWTGMIGETARKEVDIAAGPLVVTSMRSKVVDFTRPYMSSGLTILHKKPPTIDESLLLLLSPFENDLWFLIGLVYFVVSVSMYLIARFNPYETSLLSEEDGKESIRVGLSSITWFTCNTLLWQGYDKPPRSIATRCLSVVWFIFVFFTATSYTASLVNFLQAPRGSAPMSFTNVKQLAKPGFNIPVVISNSRAADFFKTSKIPIYQGIYRRLVYAKDLETGVSMVKESSRYAFITESVFAEHVEAHECDVKQAGGPLDSVGLSFAVPINSNIRNILDDAILKLKENGKVQLLINKWVKAPGPCIKERDQEVPPCHVMAYAISVTQFSAAVIFAALGLLLSLVISAIEMILYARSQKSPPVSATQHNDSQEALTERRASASEAQASAFQPMETEMETIDLTEKGKTNTHMV